MFINALNPKNLSDNTINTKICTQIPQVGYEIFRYVGLVLNQ